MVLLLDFGWNLCVMQNCGFHSGIEIICKFVFFLTESYNSYGISHDSRWYRFYHNFSHILLIFCFLNTI